MYIKRNNVRLILQNEDNKDYGWVTPSPPNYKWMYSVCINKLINTIRPILWLAYWNKSYKGKKSEGKKKDLQKIWDNLKRILKKSEISILGLG